MYTLQGTAKNPVQIEMENNIRVCFEADGALTKGQIVSLASNGKVAAIQGATEFPIGHVLVPAVDSGQATVSLAARAVVRGVANGAVTCGQLVSATADGFAASANYDMVAGVALQTAADGAELEIAVLYSPFVYWVD